MRSLRKTHLEKIEAVGEGLMATEKAYFEKERKILQGLDGGSKDDFNVLFEEREI